MKKNPNYSVRKNCIFCNHELFNTYFTENLSNFVAHYSVDNEYDNHSYHKIPFNVCICDNCKTPQIKYLGELNEVYRINHADSTGEVMSNLHIENSKFIIKYKDSIKNIIEIGSSKGILADLLLDKLNLTYFIIEPTYFGSFSDNKIIINDFYENVRDETIGANTLIMSHVLEHFYEPIKILEKIYNNQNITNIFLTFPDLEYYINNGVYHVLNTEHTFYVDTDFLIGLFDCFGFELVEKNSYKNHSILFYFKKNNIKNKKICFENKNYNLENKNYNLEDFFRGVQKSVNKFNKIIEDSKTKNVYIWPASIHSLYLLMFGLNEDKLSGFTDNSINKIGKKMYGTKLNVFNYKLISEDASSIILINGGIFNSEINKNKSCQ